MQIIPVRTRLFLEGESLSSFILGQVPVLEPGDILVVTSKIMALSQGRVLPPGFDKRQAILDEADEIVETPWCLLARKGKDWCANAGADESNADGKLILLPRESKESTVALRRDLAARFTNPFGVILTDTRIVPFRQGTMGMALAWSGFTPIHDYVGTPDLYGRLLKMTKANFVHALAAAAVLVMGEGAESIPLAVIRRSGVVMDPEASGEVGDIAVEPKNDLYRFLFVADSATGVDNKAK
jgi:coenzyme F420-0:L-glutamate ligase